MNTDLELQVVQWATEKGIFEESTPTKQLLKTLEEAKELTVAVLNDNDEEILLELGDVLVTLVIQAHFHGFTATDCLEAAYNKISKRKGKMVDGVFVKEEDL